jgi:putative transposase
MNIVDSITWITILGQKYRHENHSVSLVNYHFVFCPARRKKILVDDIRKRLRKLINDKADELNLEVIALEVDADHVHLFIGCHPDIAPSKVMHRLKGYTSKVLRDEFPELKRLPSLWTRSYFCSTAGNVSRETIKKYIAEHSSK